MRIGEFVKKLACNLTAILFFACSTVTHSTSSPELTLFTVEKLKAGVTTREQAQELFGDPDLKPTILELKEKETWLYLTSDKTSTRLSLIFDHQDGKLFLANWFVSPEDPESNFEFIKNRYKPTQFEKRKASWSTPDAGPDQIFYVDQRLGLKIAYGKTQNRVEALIWSKPTHSKFAEK